MKFNPSYFPDTETNSVGEMIKSKMISNQKAFHVLSTKIYSDIHVAIIRELSTNAMDSHIEAGKPDLPIDVHLPTSMEPWLSIQDYGIGMDGETIEGVFSNFFDSTKDNNNSVNGCLGIGSKAPFGYTPNFTIEGVKDGKKYVYGTSVTSAGEPGVIPMGVFDTDECNGAKITIAIKEEDFEKFNRAASVVFFAFDVTPNVTGIYHKIDKSKKHLGAGVYHYTNVSASNLGVVMGNVYYRIDKYRPEFKKFDITNMYGRGAIVIHADLGDIDFQPSREEVNYTDKTVAFVMSHLQQAEQIILVNIKKRFSELKTDAEKFRFYSEFEGNVIEKRYLLSELRKLYPNVFANTDIHYSYASMDVSDIQDRIGGKITLYSAYTNGYNHETSETTSVTLSYKSAVPYYNEPDITVIIQEGKRGIMTAAKTWAREAYVSKLNEKRADSHRYYPMLMIITPNEDKPFNKQRFIERYSMFCNSIMFDDEIFNLTKVESTAKNTIKAAKLLVDVHRGGKNTYVLRDTSTISSGKKFYIPLNGMAPDYDKVKIPKSKTLDSFINDYIALDTGFVFSQTPIYGIMKKDLELLDTDSDWVDFIDFIHKDINANVDKIIKITATKTFKNIGSFAKITKSKDFEVFETGIFSKNSNEIIQIMKSSFGIDITNDVTSHRKKLDVVKSKYPLLNMIDKTKHFNTVEIAAIQQYIDGVNK